MGKTWGNLAYIRNLVIIRMSPYEQSGFANFWSNSLRGLKRDFFANAPYIIPRKSSLPVRRLAAYPDQSLLFAAYLGAWLLVQWAVAENERMSRKNPRDYENDV